MGEWLCNVHVNLAEYITNARQSSARFHRLQLKLEGNEQRVFKLSLRNVVAKIHPLCLWRKRALKQNNEISRILESIRKL